MHTYTQSLKPAHVQACRVQEKVVHHSVIHLVLYSPLVVKSNAMNPTGKVWHAAETPSVLCDLSSERKQYLSQNLKRQFYLQFSILHVQT